MLVEICDDFVLEKITLSGQCFRARRMPDGAYRFIICDEVIYIREVENQKFSVSCSYEKWRDTWSYYFDLGRCYKDIFETECDKHIFAHEAMTYGRGLRILRQNPWETLITFIISQRKSIPAISKSVDLLASKFGHRIETNYETLYSFPTPQEMSDVTEQELIECGLGYRTKYILDAIRQVTTGSLNLEILKDYSDEQLLESLQIVHGVGKKVANCVALFAYGRTACVPIDVWISRAIENDCGGESPFGLFGQNAGIIQQYIFYYEKRRQRQIEVPPKS